MQRAPRESDDEETGRTATRAWRSYNEVVLDGAVWQARLPELIEAVFVPVHGNVKNWAGGNAQTATDTRNGFAAAHSISPAESVPAERGGASHAHTTAQRERTRRRATRRAARGSSAPSPAPPPPPPP